MSTKVFESKEEKLKEQIEKLADKCLDSVDVIYEEFVELATYVVSTKPTLESILATLKFLVSAAKEHCGEETKEDVQLKFSGAADLMETVIAKSNVTDKKVFLYPYALFKIAMEGSPSPSTQETINLWDSYGERKRKTKHNRWVQSWNEYATLKMEPKDIENAASEDYVFWVREAMKNILMMKPIG